MNLRIRGVSRALVGMLGLAVTVAGAGCGGGHNNYPDSSVHFDARPGTGGGSGDAGVRPTPVIGDRVATLASGAAFLVGSGSDSCTSQDPPSGDRWCAFTMPSNFAGGDDLWVINVTKAAAGTPIKCDVSDLNCLLLSSTLYTGDLTLHSFFGDTLIFYADAGQTTAAGYAWRPGMNSARRLTTNALPGGCAGHSRTDAVRCLQNPDSTTVTTQRTFDLSAGYVTSGSGPLPKVTTFIASLTSDPASTSAVTQPARYRANLSADGTWIAWSARPDPASPETLVAQKIGDASTRVTIAQDISRWAFSRDGNSLYWLKSFNYDPAAPLGTLQSTPFPVPPPATPPTVSTVRPNTSFFAPVGETGLLILGALNSSTGVGQLSLITNSTQSTPAKVLDEAVSQPLSVSLDGRDVVYSRSGLDLLANGADFASECTMTTTAAALPFGTFSDPPTTVFWVKPDTMTGKYLGYYTTTANCQSQMFTTGFWTWAPVKDQGLVYGDDVFIDDLGNVGDVTLRYASLTGGALPATGSEIQQRANPTFGLLLPYLSAVVYTINTGGSTDGIYLRGDLPFVATPAPPPPLQHPDAGADPTDANAVSGADGGADASAGG